MLPAPPYISSACPMENAANTPVFLDKKVSGQLGKKT
jgi:hypothetical protein